MTASCSACRGDRPRGCASCTASLPSTPATGALTTRGDNRLTDDHFGVTADDVDGRVLLHIPWAGQVLFIVSRWWFLAPVLGVLTALIMWPRRRPAPALGTVAEDTPA